MGQGIVSYNFRIKVVDNNNAAALLLSCRSGKILFDLDWLYRNSSQVSGWVFMRVYINVPFVEALILPWFINSSPSSN